MAKDRFTANPFPGLELSAFDADNILDIVNTIVDTGLQRYENFTFVEKTKVDTTKWKAVKSKENAHVFFEQHQNQRPSPRSQSLDSSVAELSSLLTVGTTIGTLDDVMFCVVNPTVESMRIKAYDDLNAMAVLSNLVMPTEEAPFRSVVIKWMELDILFQSTGLVQNRDCVFVEATGTTETFDGECVGFHVLHSVNFPQAPSLPNRVRANLSICGFFRQVSPNLVSIYISGIVDPVGNDRVRRRVVSNMASTFLSTLKYAHCGQMKKLAWALDTVHSKSKLAGVPDPERVCVTCRKRVSRRVGDFGKSSDSCKLCFGIICGSCTLQRKLSFIGPDPNGRLRSVQCA